MKEAAKRGGLFHFAAYKRSYIDGQYTRITHLAPGISERYLLLCIALQENRYEPNADSADDVPMLA